MDNTVSNGDQGEAAQRLVAAEAKLAQAVHRLRALQSAALYGNYDAADFDRAVLTYREARSEAYDARNAWAHQQQREAAGMAGTAAVGVMSPPEAPAEVAFEPTPRMQFVRWLVQTGRLSEWPAGTHPPSAP
jgi:hypothetical protein